MKVTIMINASKKKNRLSGDIQDRAEPPPIRLVKPDAGKRNN